jgi:hypothetical protein
MLTPERHPANSSPPPVVKNKRIARFTEALRTLDFPEIQTEKTVAFESGCYYATTTRDVCTMTVYFVEVLEMYADTVLYRIAPQTLHCSLDIKTAKERLQHTDVQVGTIFTDANGTFFEAPNKINTSLMVKLES